MTRRTSPTAPTTVPGRTPNTESTTQPSAPSNKSIVPLFATLMVTMLLASLSQMSLSSALPTIVGELHGVDHMMWVITAYMLTSTIMMPVYGKVSDLIGRKPVLLAAIAIFIIGSIIGAVADTMTVLIVGRAVQGLGGGGLLILSQAAVADVVPARERGKYMGIMGGVFALSSVAGPLLGGWFTEGPGWRWVFWLNLPLGLVTLVAVAAMMHLPKKPATDNTRQDYLGMGLLAVFTTSVVLVGIWGGGTYAWVSPEILGLVLAAFATGALLVLVEGRAAEPILPLRLFKDRNFNLSTLATLLIGVAMFGALGYIPTYFQMALGKSATTAGLLMIPMMLALLVTSVVTGSMVSRTGKYKTSPIVGSVVVAVGLGLLSTVSLSTPVAMIGVYLAILGIGLGATMQILTLVVQNSFPHAMVGTATAANNYFRQVGGSLGGAVVGSLFATRLTGLLSERLPTGTHSSGGSGSLTPAAVQQLPDAFRVPIVTSYNEALMPIFAFVAPLGLIAMLALVFLREKPLVAHMETQELVDQPIAHLAHPEELSEPEAVTEDNSGSEPDRVEARVEERAGAGGAVT